MAPARLVGEAYQHLQIAPKKTLQLLIKYEIENCKVKKPDVAESSHNITGSPEVSHDARSSNHGRSKPLVLFFYSKNSPN